MDCTDADAPLSGVGPAPYDTRYTLADTGQLLRTVTNSPAGTRTVAYSYPQPTRPDPRKPLVMPDRPHAATQVGAAGYTYDTAGQLTARTGPAPISLTWTAEHTIATATAPASSGAPAVSDSYVYNPSGVRILRRGTDSSVLTLDGTELTLTGGKLTARRFYTSAGATIAVRDADGLSWLLGDRQGTPVVSVNARTLRAQTRLFGPYGEPRDDVKLAASPVRGFLNKPHDTSTGLNVLDHRSYDAAVGRLLSPDPIYQPYNPAALDVYGYANGNPTTLSDPSGLRTAPDPDCSAQCLRKSDALARLTMLMAQQDTDRRNHHWWNDVDWGGDAVAGLKGYVNFSAGFADSLTNAVTFGHNGAIEIGPAFHGPGLDASYGIGSGTSTAVQVISGAGALRSGLLALRSLPGMLREAGSVGALVRSLASGARGALAARASSASAAIKSLLGGERAAEGGGALLSTASRGAGKSLPMNMQTVCDVSCKYKIDISDVPININKARAGYAGSTSSNGTITLTRSAFANEEQLARTLAHERFHVDQIRSGMGYPTTYDAGNAWEQAAQAFEDAWWAGQ